MSGVPAEVGISIPSVNLGQRITGSYTEAPRVLVTGKPQSSAQTPASWFDYTQFRLPDIGNVSPWPRSYLRRPGINVSDVSVFKNFAMGADNNRRLQLRLEMFNAFNHPQFDNMNTSLTWEIASNFSNYKERQQAALTTIRNIRGGTNSPATGRLG